MYSSRQLLNTSQQFEIEKDRLITQMEDYCAVCWERIKTVIPRYAGLVFDFSEGDYKRFDYTNFKLENEGDYLFQYTHLCHLMYTFGNPPVFGVFAMPIELEVEDELHIVKQTCILIFAETQIHSKYGIYQYLDGKIVLNKQYTKNFWPKRYMLNMGYIIGFLPGQS